LNVRTAFLRAEPIVGTSVHIIFGVGKSEIGWVVCCRVGKVVWKGWLS